MPSNFSKQTNLIEMENTNMNQVNAEIWLNDLMNEYGQEMIWLAYSYVRDKAIAEDLTQNAFLKCYQKRNQLKDNASIRSWVYRITINGCKDYLRSSYVKRMIPTDILQSIFSRKKTESTESIYLKNDTSSILTENVFSLAPKYREVIILYYFEELKIREIKEILQLNENTIKTRLKKAKESLRKTLERGDLYNG
ncbi:RNA polymerase sigma-70 factor, ECF subfamily [Gracilibacillus orientalis]|uniref:RNA polymerase sigma-70 factor, ECF subfamily n=1 Tax=Gracilibacillus orientalis TaxID=334253 RepID=A0A1I4MFS0_9BACI|nr:sigma-70 family RNA polymerase sigma factor [Gracilibacillus orientalis]SFM01837.1 RNA polymerase sigma-70 factor, ECF subfamily [Gracilibacillus orientalis]